MRLRLFAILFVARAFMLGASAGFAQTLAPYEPNNHWLSYDGNPIVLSGNGLWEVVHDSSVSIATHNSHCTNYGGNSNRAALFSFCHETMGPWQRTGPGTANDGGLKWDLSQWNSAFWSRSHSYFQDCRSRGILVVLQVWDEPYLENGEDRWYKNPFNGDNNINGYFGLPGGDADVGRDDRFYNMSNTALMNYQNALVQKALSELAQYPIIWDIGNEVGQDTSISSTWLQHWADVFDAYETANPGVKVLSTVDTNVDAGHYNNVTNLDVVNVHGASSQHPFTLSGDPRNNPNDSRVHCKNLQIDLNNLHTQYNKPLINSRITSDVGRIDRPVSDTAGNALEARHILWTYFLGAAHFISFRTTTDAYYPDLRTEEAQQALRTFMDSFNFWECYIRNTSIVSGSDALVLAKTDEVYAFYVPNGNHFGRTFAADLAEASGSFRAQWFNPRTGSWQPQFTVAGGVSHNFTAPTDEDWALLLDRGTAILSFTDITSSSGTGGPSHFGGHGVQWADVTGDGRPDFYVTMNAGVNMAELFFRNINGAAFAEEASPRGIANDDSGSHGGAWGDLDNDGIYDLVNGSYEPNRVYENNGIGSFTDRTGGSGFLNQSYGTRGVLLFDYDLDGDLDVFCNNWEPNGEPNELYRNNGNFQFTSITANGLGGSTLGAQGCTEGDYDNDGDLDVLLCRYGNGPLLLMRNGGGNFTQQSLFASTSPRQDGATFCDVNNDGWLDVHVMSSVYQGIGTGRLFINNKNGTFTEVSVPDGPGFMAGFEDLDNDGDWDMVYPGDNKVYLNDGSGNFVASATFNPGTDQTKDPRAVAFADIDNDGDMDFYYAQKLYYNRLIRNDVSNAGNWIRVKLTAANGQAGAFGAKVKTYEAGQAGNASAMISFREARSQEGYLGQNDPILHFGAGARTSVDIQVTYLNGTVATQSNMPVNCLIPFPAEAPDIAPVTAEPGCSSVGLEYVKQLTLLGGTPPVSWSVISAPAGAYVNSAGRVRGWTPTNEQAGTTQTFQIQASNSLGSDLVGWQVEVCDLPDDTAALFPFTTNEEGWTLATWKAGQYDPGTIVWDAASGNPGGNVKCTGNGGTNNTDSCTREGGLMTRLISTEGYEDIRIEYDVYAHLNTAPDTGCTGTCTASVLEGSCEDKLVVYYSTAGAGGPWTNAQELNEGDDLPEESWMHKTISLAGVTAAEDNANFAVRFVWQFNTSADIGRIDNVTIKGTPINANQAPQVDAGSDQTIRLPHSANLSGTVSDDGLPEPPGAVTVTWSMLSGPGMVTFGDANATQTTASFGTAGVYVLKLLATDSQLTGEDLVTITVNEPTPADFDGDGDVDQTDFGIFQACLSGTGQAPDPGCEKADLDGDSDVDQPDFAQFYGCLGGPDQPPGC